MSGTMPANTLIDGTALIRIVIADDHPVVRYGLSHMLNSHSDFEVVGEAADARHVVDMVKTLNPDIVVLDMEMGDSHGVEALRGVRAVAPDLKVIVYTAYDNTDRIVAATGIGVQGYLLKDSGPHELARAIRTVHDGGIFLEPSVATKLVRGMHANQNEHGELLTARELQVLKAMAKGDRNQAIADSLFISERTVKFHVSAILAKLNAGNRTEAVKIAAERGLIDMS